MEEKKGSGEMKKGESENRKSRKGDREEINTMILLIVNQIFKADLPPQILF